MQALAMENLTKLDISLLALATWLLYKGVTTLRLRLRTTRLNGPPASSWLTGVSKEIFTGDSGTLFEEWMDEYGAVYQIPAALGSRRTIICDPRAIAHFYSKETYVYVQTSFAKNIIASMVRMQDIFETRHRTY